MSGDYANYGGNRERSTPLLRKSEAGSFVAWNFVLWAYLRKDDKAEDKDGMPCAGIIPPAFISGEGGHVLPGILDETVV